MSSNRELRHRLFIVHHLSFLSIWFVEFKNSGCPATKKVIGSCVRLDCCRIQSLNNLFSCHDLHLRVVHLFCLKNGDLLLKAVDLLAQCNILFSKGKVLCSDAVDRLSKCMVLCLEAVDFLDQSINFCSEVFKLYLLLSSLQTDGSITAVVCNSEIVFKIILRKANVLN